MKMASRASIIGSLLLSLSSAQFQFQNRGNIAALRVSAISNFGSGLAPTFIDEISPSGVVQGTLDLPIAATGAQRACLLPPIGGSSSEIMSLSQNGQFLMLPCFSGPTPGTVYGAGLGPTNGKTCFVFSFHLPFVQQR